MDETMPRCREWLSCHEGAVFHEILWFARRQRLVEEKFSCVDWMGNRQGMDHRSSSRVRWLASRETSKLLVNGFTRSLRGWFSHARGSHHLPLAGSGVVR